MQRSSDASQFPELLRHQRASDTVVYSICYNDFWMCKLTMPRWSRYAAWHHIDHVVLRGEANAGNASLASRTKSQWHKFVLTRHLFELGYEWLLFADADTAPIQWRHSVASWTNLKSSDLTGAHLKPDHKEFGAGNTTELVISRDRGHPGFYGPPIGPTNTGVWLLKNGSLARSLFDWQWDCAHHISCSVKDSNSFNTDQSSMNRWFWKHVYTGQDRHRATLLKYCFGPRRMQCELHGHGSARADRGALQTECDAGLAERACHGRARDQRLECMDPSHARLGGDGGSAPDPSRGTRRRRRRPGAVHEGVHWRGDRAGGPAAPNPSYEEAWRVSITVIVQG